MTHWKQNEVAITCSVNRDCQMNEVSCRCISDYLLHFKTLMDMKISFYLLLIVALSSSTAWCQRKYYVADNQKYYGVFDYRSSKSLDTASVDFQLAKQNVLEYCNQQLNFKIDTVATRYSCASYSKLSEYNKPEETRFVKENHLKYEFSIKFHVNEQIGYNVSFYLDTAFQVKSASETLFKLKKTNLWKIRPFENFEENAKSYNNGFVLPLDRVEIEYSEKEKKCVYVVLQKRTEQTVVTTSPIGIEYDVNCLIVDPEKGEILDETIHHYSIFTGF